MAEDITEFKGPAIYRIRIKGVLDQRYAGYFGDMMISTDKKEEGKTTSKLTGSIRDQAELMGILNALYNLHLPIVSIQPLDEESGKQFKH